MELSEIKHCPSTLAPGFSTYSPGAIRNVFYGKTVSHILDFNLAEDEEGVTEQLRQNSKIISVSGAQFKQSLVLDKNKLRLTQPGESGQFILKPVPYRPPFGKAAELPANEHLTMQIAKQVYGIATAECALIFFNNGQPAYITRRFDVGAGGRKIAQEDFATLSGLSKEKNGESYRSQGSYEDVARLIRKYVSAFAIELEKYFERILFNYLFSNGDAHLKNFSLQQTPSGDYVLSPAYDLVDTSIHIPTDSFLALDDGLYSDDYNSDSFSSLGYYAYDDFLEFGIRIGIVKSRIEKILKKYRAEHQKTAMLIEHSFLLANVKQSYISHYLDRLKMLNNSFARHI